MDKIGSLEVRWIQGFTNKGIKFVDNKTVCYPCGSHICFLNLETKMQSVLQSPGRGIGTLTANGNGGIFAFSEQKLSPSIFVYIFPELKLKNELKGTTQLDYMSLTLSDGGPYLGGCSSLPDHTITVWNWESAEPICSHKAGCDVISLVFNPLNWLQLCALGTKSLTVWNIEKSASFHVLKPSVIELPATDGSIVERLVTFSPAVSEKLLYHGPEMPPSAITGLMGDEAENILTKLCTKDRLTPTAICWTATSELYVGCVEGFLLLVNPESLSVSVLFNPTTPDAIPELRQSNFEGLTLSKNGLIAVGKESAVHCLQIKGTKINITQTWQLERPVSTAVYSPDYETLLFSSNTGQIYMLTPAQSDKIMKVLDVLGGNFVAASFLHTKEKICVSVRDSGDLQLWSADGNCLGSLSLQTEVTSLACCPIAQYAAVGTASGNVLFIDLNNEQQPRLVHQVYLYHTPVDHLVFDREGHYLLTGASDTHIYVLEAKPSKRFSVIGYTVAPGAILSLSAQCIRDCEQVKVLALCTGQEDTNHDGSLLTLLSLPAQDLTGPDGVDRHGCLSTNILKVSTYKVPHPLKSCVLGVNEVFGYCHKKKTLQRLHLPQDTDSPSSQQVVHLKPEQEVESHPLGPDCLVLSPHKLWLASMGQDGLLRIRETASMERYIELQCHSYRVDGVGRVSFSVDSQTLLTAGFQDGSLLCSKLRVEGVDAGKVNEATQYSQAMDHFLKNIFNTENPILSEWPEWGQRSPAGTEKPEESEVSVGEVNVDVTEQDESYAAPPSHPTWLESRRAAVIKEDNEQYSETKENMRKTIKELRDAIQEMIRENENCPENERLELHEFNLDVDGQRRLDAMVEEEATRVKNEIAQEILARYYLCDVLKRECWDSLKVKSRSIKAFHSEYEVKNYPLKERTEKELEDLRRVENMRKLEKAACTLQQSSLKKSSNTASMKEVEQGKEGHETESAALTGSISTQLGCSNSYLYDQFSLKTREQRINQIILLQDVIYRIKTAFDADFEAMYRQKVQELSRMRERNRRIRKIMEVLDMNEEQWEPSLTISEQPEKLLTVDDSEIKAEKYFTPEQKKEEERKKLEEQRRLAAKDDAFRDRALDDMMDGVLEVTKENILKKEIPPPEFVLTKPDIQWTEEEKKVYKEYEKKTKDLKEEKDKYMKSLEGEVKKLQESTKDATVKFDETLTKLFEKKIKCDMAISQEELKITHLSCSVLVEEEMTNGELELEHKLEKATTYKDEIGEEVKRHEEEVALFHKTYDSIVDEDKHLDEEFKKEFADVPGHLTNLLYKLFKRRPRGQKMRTQTDNSLNPFKESRLCGSQAPDAFFKMLKALDEMDAPENMPEGLKPAVWERFCHYRRMKVESEQKVKDNALTLAEMQAFLQKRRDEEQATRQEIENLSDKLESLHTEKKRFLMDIMVQVLLQQGQVEVPITGLTADYTDAVLVHRSVVEDLNRTIKSLGEQKMAYMEKRKDLRKNIKLMEWEKKKRMMQIEDLTDKARDIQMLQLSEEQKDYLKDRDSCMSKQVSTLQKTIDLQEKAHQQKVQHCKKKIKQLNRQAAKKAEQNATLEKQLSDLQVDVAELRHISEAIDDDQGATTEERYQEIVQRKKLEAIVRAQAEELAVLQAEVERLRMKNFPSLQQLEHN